MRAPFWFPKARGLGRGPLYFLKTASSSSTIYIVTGTLPFSFGRQLIAFTQPRAALQGSSVIYTIAEALSFSSGRQLMVFAQPRTTLLGSSTICSIAWTLSFFSGHHSFCSISSDTTR